MRSAMLLVGLMLAASCAGPSAPQVPALSASATTPASAAPLAALSVGSRNPALIWAGQPVTFDASSSTGEELRYLIDFGDGTPASQPTVAHVRQSDQENQKATLTVTDRFGRTDAVTVPFLVIRADTALFWTNQSRRVYLNQTGSSVTGRYWSPSGQVNVTGRILDERRIELQSADGNLRLIGTSEWRPWEPHRLGSANSVILRLSVSGGPDDGQTFDFGYASPYG